jgi:RIO-like serine/threonine protein kinase
MDGIPADAFQIDVYSLAYTYQVGATLRDLKRRRTPPGAGFFMALEDAVEQMHRRGIAHLDLRNSRNILVTNSGRPFMLDFQSSVRLARLPPRLQRLCRDIDKSGVYKWWMKLAPMSFSAGRHRELEKIHARRHYWPFRGYRLLHLGRTKRLRKWSRMWEQSGRAA